MEPPYILDLIEQVVNRKLGITLGSADASGSIRADNGELMELDDTNKENVTKSILTWSEPEELFAAGLKIKHDPDPVPPPTLPVT